MLHHETDLAIEVHYTDTAGYTDQVFGLTHLLGFPQQEKIQKILTCYAIYIRSD
nr:Tn3 family transposase [Paenibacillus sp. Mc5Re-14]